MMLKKSLVINGSKMIIVAEGESKLSDVLRKKGVYK